MRARRLLFLAWLVPCAIACPAARNSASTSTSSASGGSVSSPASPTPVPSSSASAPDTGSPGQALRSDGPPRSADAELLKPVFIDAGFATLHQTFLQYGLTAMERSAVWSHFYKNRWVHWTGQLVKVSNAAMLFRQLAATSSYDVLVRVPRIELSLRRSLKPGRIYNYVGRLDSYDDMFRTIYLEQGQIFDAGPDGVPGVLLVAPPLARKFPPPPRTYAGPPGVTLPSQAGAQASSPTAIDPLRPPPQPTP